MIGIVGRFGSSCPATNCWLKVSTEAKNQNPRQRYAQFWMNCRKHSKAAKVGTCELKFARPAFLRAICPFVSSRYASAVARLPFRVTRAGRASHFLHAVLQRLWIDAIASSAQKLARLLRGPLGLQRCRPATPKEALMQGTNIPTPWAGAASLQWQTLPGRLRRFG